MKEPVSHGKCLIKRTLAEIPRLSISRTTAALRLAVPRVPQIQQHKQLLRGVPSQALSFVLFLIDGYHSVFGHELREEESFAGFRRQAVGSQHTLAE